MKKLTNLILMSSVKMWNKRNEQNEQNNYNEMINNYKKVLKNMNKNGNDEYNYNRYRYMKQKVKRLKKLKKLHEIGINQNRLTYNNIKKGRKSVNKIKLEKLKMSLDSINVRCYNKNIERM